MIHFYYILKVHQVKSILKENCLNLEILSELEKSIRQKICLQDEETLRPGHARLILEMNFSSHIFHLPKWDTQDGSYGPAIDVSVRFGDKEQLTFEREIALRPDNRF